MQTDLAEFEIIGEKAVFRTDSTVTTFDFSKQVELLANLLELNMLAKKTQLILVIDDCNLHLKLFAKVLNEIGNNTFFIDGKNNSEANEPTNFSSVINDLSTTYLIENYDPTCRAYSVAIDKHVNSGGICVIFGAYNLDYRGKAVPQTFWLDMQDSIVSEPQKGVVVWFGNSVSRRGLSDQFSNACNSGFADYLNNHLGVLELERFEDGTISSLILPDAQMGDIQVQSARNLANSQSVDFRVRPSDYIKEWRVNKEKRFW